MTIRWSATTALSVWLLMTMTSPAQAQNPYNVRIASPVAATGNGSTDDWQAFTNVIASIPASGGEVYIPAGTYYLSKTLDIQGKNIAFRGEGQGITKLVFYGGSTNGIQFSSNASPHYTLTVRRLSVLRGAGADGAGIQAKWPQLVSPMGYQNGGGLTAIIEDVQVGVLSWPATGVHWHFGIQLSNATNAKISQFSIQTGGIAGIQIAGNLPPQGAGGKSVDVQIRDGDITSVTRGIESKDNSEAVQINSVVVRESVWGVIFWTSDGQGSLVANCQIHASNTGILVQDASHIAITNNAIWRLGAENFAGISITDGGGPIGKGYRVIGNSIFGPLRTQQRYGILLRGNVRDSVIHSNISQNMFYGIWLDGPGVMGNHVWSNINRWMDGAAIPPNAANYFDDNW